ncbi:MAG: HAD-IA family hydrolase [Candidatus Shapirobacteria bacterium]|jgi:HAD superfamily hydrolase (TIGR01509 family)
MIRCLAFDVGNVIWYFKKPLTYFRHRHASLLGIKFAPYWQKYQEVYRDFETNHLDIYQWSRSINPQITPQQIDNCLKNSLSQTRFEKHLNHRLIRLLKQLKPKFTLIMVSNAENFLFPYINQPLTSLFHRSIISWQVGVRKPEPEFYQQIPKHTGYNFKEVLYIDDGLENILAAQPLGLNTILYQNYPRLLSDLKKYLGSKI